MKALIDYEDSILIVVDVQDFFMEKLAHDIRKPLLSRIGWLIEVAKRLGIPIICTAEDIPNCGSTTEEIANRLPKKTEILNKLVFGLADQEDIMAVVEHTGRKTAVLVGLETDVCVAQSALGLLDVGYRVIVPVDAVQSPGTGHEFGLMRMQQMGVMMSSVKGLYYEWVRTVSNDDDFKNEFLDKIGTPLGIEL